MNKYYILLLFICFSLQVTKNNKSSTKNLRKLDQISVTYDSHDNYRYDPSDHKLKFDVKLKKADGLIDGETYSLTIAYKTGKVSSSCTYDSSSTTLNCYYECDQPYYGQIQLLNNNGALSTDTLLLGINGIKTLQQTVELTYKNALVEFISPSTGTVNNLIRVYIEETREDNSFYQLDIKIGGSDSQINCTYSTSESCLKCERSSTSALSMKLLKEKKDGSIQWTNDASYDFEKTLLIKLKILTSVYGYHSNFEYGKWSFYVRATNINAKPDYYYTMIVTLGKSSGSLVKTEALCYMEGSYGHVCTVEKIIDPEDGIQEASDFVYIPKDQTGSTLSFEDQLKQKLPDNKQVSRLITFKFIKAYGLKYNSNSNVKAWEFKIEVDTSPEVSNIVRNGLNVTLDLFNPTSTYTTGSCLYNNKVLSCVSDYINQDSEMLFCLDLERNYQLNHVPVKVGSVTWSNANEYTDKIIKMPLDVELTYDSSYNLRYEGEKWIFYMKAKSPNNNIPKDSKITIDILYDTNQQTVAECGKNTVTGKGYTIEFTCECNTVDDTKTLSINNQKIKGSVTWLSASDIFSIKKKVEFKYIKTKNLILNNKIWSFEIEFEDTKGINPTTSDNYKTFFSYSYNPESTSIYESSAKCNLKTGTNNIFTCVADGLSGTSSYNYIFFMKKSNTKVDIDTISWIDIPETYTQIPVTIDLTFISGLINYENYYLNLTVNIPEGKSLPIKGTVIVDINKGSSATTLECLVQKQSVLQCQIGADSMAYSFTNIKSELSTVTWQNLQTNYYFDLYAKLDFKSANNLVFTNNNKWQFDLQVTQTISPKIKMKIDILYNDSPATATCTNDEKIICICDLSSQSKNDIIRINHIKGEGSTITWNLLQGPQHIITNAELNVKNVKHLSYESSKQKWEFKMILINCELPINSAVEIDITYERTHSTATCIHKVQDVLTCTPDVETQLKSHSLTINYQKNLGSVTYISGTDHLNILSSIELTFDKAYDLKLVNGNWTFKVQISESTGIKNNDDIQIDAKFNNIITKVSCKYIIDNSLKNLVCSKPKTNNKDRIVLINSEENQDLVWSNLDKDVELYVSLSIELKNCYGGFKNGKWLFNIKYGYNGDNIETINNYASLTVSNDKEAICEITQKFLLCELNYEEASENDQLYITMSQKGSITFTKTISETGIYPISIKIKNHVINDVQYNNENNLLRFKIKGNLDDGTETEIASNTITMISLLVDSEIYNTICLTNEVNNSPIVELSCEEMVVINTKTDDVYISVDSNKKSNYVTFSTTDSIIVLNHNNYDKLPDNLGFIMKFNKYLFLAGLVLLI